MGWIWNDGKAHYSTKCTQMYQFIEIHGGVEQELHVKYAEVITVLFVTLMYGPGIPFLYIVAVFHYFFYWSMARFTLIKKVQQPHAMDDNLIQGYISWMKWAPIIYMYMAYWMLSNK